MIKNEELYIPCLFYADDGLILAESIEDADEQLNTLKTESAIYGLEITIDKSEAILFNTREKPENVGGR